MGCLPTSDSVCRRAEGRQSKARYTLTASRMGWVESHLDFLLDHLLGIVFGAFFI
jgi:hypothetical protein